MDLAHAGQYLNVARIKIRTDTDRAQHGLPRAGRAVNFKTEADQPFDYLLNLLLTGLLLHGYDHG